MAHESEGDWGEYRRLILQELQRLHQDLNEVKEQIGILHSAVAVLQFKSGLWGFAAGAIPGVAALIYAAVKT